MERDPPETTQLVVGGWSLAVTNAGEYVFLLEKGREYSYGTIPHTESASYAAVDDIATAGGNGALQTETEYEPGVWTEDGGLAMTAPSAVALGRLCWLPVLRGWPDVPRIGPESGELSFTAILEDYRGSNAVSFAWGASAGMPFTAPNAQTTQLVLDDMPSWMMTDIYATAALGGYTLRSTLSNVVYGAKIYEASGIGVGGVLSQTPLFALKARLSSLPAVRFSLSRDCISFARATIGLERVL